MLRLAISFFGHAHNLWVGRWRTKCLALNCKRLVWSTSEAHAHVIVWMRVQLEILWQTTREREGIEVMVENSRTSFARCAIVATCNSCRGACSSFVIVMGPAARCVLLDVVAVCCLCRLLAGWLVGCGSRLAG